MRRELLIGVIAGVIITEIQHALIRVGVSLEMIIIGYLVLLALGFLGYAIIKKVSQ